MATYGYGNVAARGFIGFEPALEQDAWKEVVTKKYAEEAAKNAAVLLHAPLLVGWKLRLGWAIEGVVAALGARSLVELDAAWDAAQRRLFHRIAAGRDDEDPAVQAAADRLAARLLAGTGIQQTQLDLDEEVDFAHEQLRLTGEDGPLAEDAKKAKLGDALAGVKKTTDALAKALGRGTGAKRQAPSRRQRDAVAECAAAFNTIHDELVWLAGRAPAGAERDQLQALLKPLEDLLARYPSTGAAQPQQPPAQQGAPGVATPAAADAKTG